MIPIVKISIVLFAFVGILFFLAMKTDGFGLLSFEARGGPCDSYGENYKMTYGRCVNFPEGKVCSNNAFERGQKSRMFNGKCTTDMPSEIPYEFSNEYLASNVPSCHAAFNDGFVCKPKNSTECPNATVGNYTWKWGNMYELCFKMKDNSTKEIPLCDRVFPEDDVCDPFNNDYLCPEINKEQEGWSYNNLDHLCYKWTK